MSLAVIIVLFMIVFFLSGTPIFFALGLTVVFSIFCWGQVPPQIIFQQTFQGIDSFGMLAIPLFMLMGEIMTRTKVVDDLLFVCNIILGHIRGALAHVNIVVSVLFAGISGSPVSDTATVGGILIPAMKKNGYDAEFSVAVTAISSVISPIIPPSICMVMYGALIPGVSIAALFAGGIIPGLLLAVAMMVVTAILSSKRKYPKSTITYTPRQVVHALVRTIPALMIPFIIRFGVVNGIFTPTECAAVAVLYAMALGFFYYRNFTFRDLCICMKRSMLTSGAVLVIIAMVQPFGWLVALGQIPVALSNAILSISENPHVILGAITVLLLILGAIMDANIIVLVFAPILVPIAMELGIHPVHFGVFYCLAAIVGLSTPPYGMCIFIAAAIGEVPVGKAMRAILPFVVSVFIVVFMVAYIPELTLWMPRTSGLL